ncbi:hypothetical protein [Gaoshiqia sediminis]|uniref:Uncharacterized protein n=1 Tax=Gaoshiqia sediminis TaxID=2986998 RepID=A0AA42C9K1_9BACT|nr:hypothetical protein [Gaoshiqia sediminis]MCW0484081.1 hypothetical protein [Gaoshiqia sediminis]
MISFADLGIEIEPEGYTEEKISINDIVNVEIEVIDFRRDVATKNGERYVVRINYESRARIFFTQSKRIIAALENEKIKFPFRTTIKTYKAGEKRGYMFT